MIERTHTYFLVYHKPSEGFLPVKARTSTYYVKTTAQTPSDVLQPRLFATHADAAKAVNWWLKGVLEVEIDAKTGRRINSYRKIDDRRREDMEIVSVDITITLDPEQFDETSS